MRNIAPEEVFLVSGHAVLAKDSQEVNEPLKWADHVPHGAVGTDDVCMYVYRQTLL